MKRPKINIVYIILVFYIVARDAAVTDEAENVADVEDIFEDFLREPGARTSTNTASDVATSSETAKNAATSSETARNAATSSKTARDVATSPDTDAVPDSPADATTSLESAENKTMTSSTEHGSTAAEAGTPVDVAVAVDDDDFLVKTDDEDGDVDVYVNEFAVEMEGDSQEAELIASIYGFRVKSLRYLKGVFLFMHPATPARSKRSADDVLTKLKDDPHVHFVEQQKHLRRDKRSDPGSYKSRYAEAIGRAYDEVNRAIERRLGKRTIGEERPEFNDPQYGKQWYLSSSGHVTRSASSGLDLNTAVVWASGYTGRGVVVTVLDDGLQHNHTDIARNYDPQASGDLNDDDDDPTPNFAVPGNDHGTMCSGEIAAVADNSKCGIGVAYNSKIGAVRMLDGIITDVVESGGLGFGVGHVDIYSASWGPTDDGTKMQAPGHYAMTALLRGIREGRAGKGSIYVWAGGNGGIKDDSGNADGYVSSIYTIAVGSLDGDGESNYFNEPASSLMAMVVTGGRKGYGQPGPPGNVITTGWHDRCVETFGGTSAAAPLMAGCLALVLEANPDLTWRDVQHVVARGARLVNPDLTLWTINGAGYHVSHDFGFGMADCGLMVALAQDWINVDAQRTCEVPNGGISRLLPASSTVALNLTTDACAQTNDAIARLEHVEVKVVVSHPIRGQLELVLVSPAGTRSVVMKTRKRDKATTGIDFKFMSVHFWGEDPRGTWRLEVSDRPEHGSGSRGRVTHFSLVLYGTPGPASSTGSPATNESQEHVRRDGAANTTTTTTKQRLEEIHEEERRRSRRVSIRRKRTSAKKKRTSEKESTSQESLKDENPGGESSLSSKHNEKDEKNDNSKHFTLSDEEREIVKRLLNDLEEIKGS